MHLSFSRHAPHALPLSSSPPHPFSPSWSPALPPQSGGSFIEWLGKARVSLDLGVKAFIEQDSTSALDFIDPRRVLGLAWKVGVVELLGSQYWQIAKFFKTDKMRALFSFQARLRAMMLSQ